MNKKDKKHPLNRLDEIFSNWLALALLIFCCITGPLACGIYSHALRDYDFSTGVPFETPNATFIILIFFTAAGLAQIIIFTVLKFWVVYRDN